MAPMATDRHTAVERSYRSHRGKFSHTRITKHLKKILPSSPWSFSSMVFSWITLALGLFNVLSSYGSTTETCKLICSLKIILSTINRLKKPFLQVRSNKYLTGNNWKQKNCQKSYLCIFCHFRIRRFSFNIFFILIKFFQKSKQITNVKQMHLALVSR